MNKLYTLIAAFLLVAPHFSLPILAVEKADTLFVVKKDYSVDAFPGVMVKAVQEKGNKLVVTDNNGDTFSYDLADLEAYDKPTFVARPAITSFKFNNKFNHQLYADTTFVVSDDAITGDVAAIGRWLTPSFKVSDSRAEVYLDDTVRLRSKVSRVRFADKHRITCAYPGMRVLKSVLVKPAVDGETSIEATEIPLTSDMLYTNAPSNYSNQDLDQAIDNNPSTYFHSTWGSGAYEKLPEDEFPYIDVTLPNGLHSLQVSYQNRHDTGNRSATSVSVMASEDGQSWQEVYRFMEATGLSTESGAVNTSSVIKLDRDCRYFRLLMLSANYKNYFCVAELKFYEATETVEEASPAEYRNTFVPMGHEYQFRMNWLTDKAQHTPSIYVDIDGSDEYGYSVVPDSKTYYYDATIRIDGAGVFPDMESTPVKIKGRGNSSWNGSNSWSKNPYRLKFDKKVKPFGLTKGKSWVLLANRQSGSMTSNAIGMYAAGLVGTDGANHIIPVELYMNGDYWGSYNFTEKVGLSNNSIDLADEMRAAFLELDTYGADADETRCTSSPGNLPVKIKFPEPGTNGDVFDLTTTELTSTDQIMDRFNAFTKLVNQGEDISSEVDVESLARYLLAVEFIENYELTHPKSTFLYHPDVLDPEAKFHWGPVWDLDWSFGYEYHGRSYFQGGATEKYWNQSSFEASAFMRKLRQAGEPLDRAMYVAWTRFMRDHLEEIIDYCDEYYSFASPSLTNNNNSAYWSDKDYTDYATTTANAKKWLRSRANYLYRTLTPYELTDEELNGYPSEEGGGEGSSDLVVDTEHGDITRKATLFDVYDMSGVRLKHGATYNNFRSGLAPGLYIVNGKKVLIR